MRRHCYRVRRCDHVRPAYIPGALTATPWTPMTARAAGATNRCSCIARKECLCAPIGLRARCSYASRAPMMKGRGCDCADGCRRGTRSFAPNTFNAIVPGAWDARMRGAANLRTCAAASPQRQCPCRLHV